MLEEQGTLTKRIQVKAAVVEAAEVVISGPQLLSHAILIVNKHLVKRGFVKPSEVISVSGRPTELPNDGI